MRHFAGMASVMERCFALAVICQGLGVGAAVVAFGVCILGILEIGRRLLWWAGMVDVWW